MSDTHPSLIEKPVLSVADLHLIAKVFTFTDVDTLTLAEAARCGELEDILDVYLIAAVGDDWFNQEALVA